LIHFYKRLNILPHLWQKCDMFRFLLTWLRGQKLLKYNEAPAYLQQNPFIHTGYRLPHSFLDCIRSVLEIHNETLNIWTHLLGFLVFSTLLLWDSFSLPSDNVSWHDVAVILCIITCYQVCMILSVTFHTLNAYSASVYDTCLFLDLTGIAASLMATYVSGIYYAFWCQHWWRNFYLFTVFLIVVFALVFWKKLNEAKYETERLVFFTFWAAYGTVPTLHWIFLSGGIYNEIVRIFLPRIVIMYLISGAAFIFYLTKIPERFIPGKVDIFGNSHQLWHVLVFACLAYWHNTGYILAEFRLTNRCSDQVDEDLLASLKEKYWISF